MGTEASDEVMIGVSVSLSFHGLRWIGIDDAGPAVAEEGTMNSNAWKNPIRNQTLATSPGICPMIALTSRFFTRYSDWTTTELDTAGFVKSTYVFANEMT